jgi:hypothetical protein
MEQWPLIVDIINQNLYKKDILFYFKDQILQKEVTDLGWSGEVKNASGDYFMVVDANMGAFKTDSVVNKKINYQLTEEDDKFKAKLTINYSHNGSFDWRTTKYRTYTRVLAPLGSKLISVKGSLGGSEAKILSADSFNENFTMGQKTVFGVFFEVNPGEIGSLIFEYELPERSKKNYQSYSLLAQKQPGSNIEELSIDLRFENKVKSYSPSGFSIKNDNDNVKWKTDFSTDKIFEVFF